VRAMLGADVAFYDALGEDLARSGDAAHATVK
jgi:hypothetical protein